MTARISTIPVIVDSSDDDEVGDFFFGSCFISL
jgi:hypothetical protein